MRGPTATAARSDRGTFSSPARRTRLRPTSTAAIDVEGVPAAAPRPPTTYATPPTAAAAACVVAAGNVPSLVTRPFDGLYTSTTLLAVPFSREPPAITRRSPTAVTAG